MTFTITEKTKKRVQPLTCNQDKYITELLFNVNTNTTLEESIRNWWKQESDMEKNNVKHNKNSEKLFNCKGNWSIQQLPQLLRIVLRRNILQTNQVIC